ncbi:hypothetical protein IW261DRAFT_1666073 [Armillaria novae-zelandiae]|uniref:Uncharacterized protein n=1 Tax=Armillaria novae-zelandiae TaxID=153914 RepID=A0AA39NUA7_9AGAR|nr:hypothetical protein IW261DRAFT_1666073 [Armillaria novae-zelandiae]
MCEHYSKGRLPVSQKRAVVERRGDEQHYQFLECLPSVRYPSDDSLRDNANGSYGEGTSVIGIERREKFLWTKPAVGWPGSERPEHLPKLVGSLVKDGIVRKLTSLTQKLAGRSEDRKNGLVQASSLMALSIHHIPKVREIRQERRANERKEDTREYSTVPRSLLGGIPSLKILGIVPHRPGIVTGYTCPARIRWFLTCQIITQTMPPPPTTPALIVIIAAITVLFVAVLVVMKMRQRRTRLLGWSGDPLSETRLDENEARRGQEMSEDGKLPLVQNGTSPSWSDGMNER